MEEGYTKPLLRWAGSKRKLIPHLRRFWSDAFDRYVEPFAGSACLFFNLRPQKAILSDINPELINLYRVVKSSPGLLAEAVRGWRRSKKHYLHLRSTEFENDRVLRAARFLYLNRYCFNGLYRTDSRGRFNVPYGGKGTGRLPDLAGILQCSSALRRATLLRADFEDTLRLAKRGDFVYLDPPFSVSNRRVFKEYQPSIFGLSDLDRLRSRLEWLDRKGISFVTSYLYSEEARNLAKGFDVYQVRVRRNIAGFALDRKRRTELLITNIRPREG